MINRKLTLKDLSKEDLIMAVEALPLLSAFFTQERIAHFMLVRKYNEAERIEVSVKKINEMLKKCRARKAKADLIKQHNTRVRRYKKLSEECTDLIKRFPNIVKK